MSKDCINRYQLCRENAGFAQEQAAEKLNISVRRLSDYENGHVRVPDAIVGTMAEIYNAPILACWHLKEHSPLGKYLPEIYDPKTHPDMFFQVSVSKDSIAESEQILKEIIKDAKLTMKKCRSLKSGCKNWNVTAAELCRQSFMARQ